MSLEITSTPIKLDWNRRSAELTMSGNAKDVLDIRAVKPEIEVNTTPGQLSIDQTQCFAEAGLKNIKAFMQDSVAYAREKINQGIARIVDEGNTWSEIQNPSDPIPDQAQSNAYGMFEHEFNYAEIPQSRPEMKYVEGKANVSVNRGYVENQTKPEKVDIQYQPWQIDYFIKQYNQMNINYVSDK